ncbi:hypothetical protein NXH64_00930 [Butyrivibrio fibrisolvens]|uniref:hypothetical protein n=1 Tax=Pseudobutyrivibrio ruminis TaxID=46206 RepID=UPI00041DFE43|nr:hypothetical protein [Pseudobutyrivibrio ruminis]MDC7278055.1 hypothetical protein [Butyrivibrio fibrisolvens]
MSEVKSSYIENNIKEILFNYPKELCLYSDYLNKECNTSLEDLYKILLNLRIYYNKLSIILKKGVFAITPNDIESINSPEQITYLCESSYPNGHNEIAKYQSFLANNKLITAQNIYCKEPVVQKISSPTISKYKKPRCFKAIKSLEKISYNYHAEIPFSKRTIDGRISIVKKILSKYSDYTYIFFDHEKGDYIKDNTGKIVEKKSFIDAKQFVKELYEKNWKKWKNTTLTQDNHNK